MRETPKGSVSGPEEAPDQRGTEEGSGEAGVYVRVSGEFKAILGVRREAVL